MSTIPHQDKHPPGDSPGGGKSRGNRLARRARSFKEDFLGILSQMRSPGGTGTRTGSRAASPSSPRPHGLQTERPPSAEMDANVRQAQLALKHFRDVVDKDKLEMLPGNGTVVLETVTAIHVLLKKYLTNEQSSILVSASNQVYQSLAKLIRLCDDYLLVGDKAQVRESVSEVLKPVEDAIQNLVSLSKDKLGMRDIHASDHQLTTPKPRTLSDRTSLDASQRSSLPDIPLTPREREILEQTSAFVLERHSHSSENVLRDSPPPKPPHPDRVPVGGFPPPLPPKKRQKQLEDTGDMKTSLENLSLRSKSPGDSSSLFSASAGSLDSVLNHSREDELRNLLDDSLNPAYMNGSSHSCYYWDSSSSTSTELKATENAIMLENSGVKHDRFSGSQAESGFASMPSRRSSSQSYSTCSQQHSSARSSQISHTSQESHHTERKVSKEATTNLQHFQQSNSVVDSSSSSSSNSVRLVTNGVSVSKQTTKVSYSARAFMESSCACAPEPWVDGDIVSYCPTHKPKSSPENALVPSHLDNPIEDGWSLFSSPSQEEDSPPALPEKTRHRGMRRERHPSQYDNVPEGSSSILSMSSTSSQHQTVSSRTVSPGGDVVDACETSLMEASRLQEMTVVNSEQGLMVNSAEANNRTMVHSNTSGGVTDEEAVVLRSALSSMQNTVDGRPPPLPMKKKHIMAYMEMFGNASHANTAEFMRHSVHVYQQHHQQNLTLSSTQSCSVNLNMHSLRAVHQSLDPRTLRAGLPPALPPKRSRLSSTRSSTTSPPTTPTHTTDPSATAVRLESELPVPESPPLEVSPSDASPTGTPSDPACASVLDQIDISQYLVLKKPDDEGPDIRGGHPDALLIHATKAHKNDFLYQEAFLTTYRTFMSPLQLIQKLCDRYDSLSSTQDPLKQRAARESFSLLVRVVSDLTLSDVDTVVLQTLMEFVQALLCRGDLTMAKALRVVMLSKYEAKKLQAAVCSLPSHHVTTRQSTLLDFKSEHIAEQMTLLDAELFLKIEIPEVLIWAQEQNEERSPNLTRFTEHFNKMSYWARSRILEQNEARERERYVIKFIKIMKHLRKMNNFNSYLALLSALDSAPIRRLEWQKHITEGLKEYCALIDSSSSFRAYRQALAETHPPCIPYIGLVLQDLTFVHIGNSNLLPDGGINFSKRWQQFNIVENMKRFKKGMYPHRKHERIIAFFNGFDESLSEEAMWQISEKIKPRGGKKL